MPNSTIETVSVYLPATNKLIANISLNGYNIRAGAIFPHSGAMRSFKLESGDLWDVWSVQRVLVVRDATGQEASVRIAALPSEEGSTGFVEFV